MHDGGALVPPIRQVCATCCDSKDAGAAHLRSSYACGLAIYALHVTARHGYFGHCGGVARTNCWVGESLVDRCERDDLDQAALMVYEDSEGKILQCWMKASVESAWSQTMPFRARPAPRGCLGCGKTEQKG